MRLHKGKTDVESSNPDKALIYSFDLCSSAYANVEGRTHGVTNVTLYRWCEQIASGMEYLASKQVATVLLSDASNVMHE